MQILKHLGGAPVMFGDVRAVRVGEGEVWISNCGSQATTLAGAARMCTGCRMASRRQWKIGGAAPQAVNKPGRVTMARLTRQRRRYIMLIAGGECLDVPREKLMRDLLGFSPHGFVRLDGDPRTFAHELRSNHLSLVYGDFVPHLLETCRILGIRPLV